MPYKIAILWRGDREARQTATPHNNRYDRIFAELAALGVEAEPAIFAEELADEVRRQLLRLDGVLVWVDPLAGGRSRAVLDPLLREVAARGVMVSAHPDVILKMGTKEVLYRTRDLGWGTDTHFYRTAAAFAAGFPARLRSGGARVLKRNRGNGGQGVWKVEAAGDGESVRVLQAERGSLPEQLPLAAFMMRCQSCLETDGGLLDQPFQPRLPDGMIRCYMGTDRVVGFGQQRITALLPPPPEGPGSPAAQPGPRIMHGAEAPAFQRLRASMEQDWTPGMMRLLGLDRAALPIVWDADFLYGPRTAAGEDSYVLCEINVSSVFAVPDEAPAAIARLTLERLRAGG